MTVLPNVFVQHEQQHHHLHSLSTPDVPHAFMVLTHVSQTFLVPADRIFSVVRIASWHLYLRHLEPLLQHHVSTQRLLLILLCVKSYLTLRRSAYNLTRFMITSRHVVDAVIPTTVCLLKSDSILPPTVESLQLETYLWTPALLIVANSMILLQTGILLILVHLFFYPLPLLQRYLRSYSITLNPAYSLT
mgnify:FL=1